VLVRKSENGWELHTIACGKLSCENFNLQESDISRVESVLFPVFKDRMEAESVFTFYDNWSGVFIMQNAGKNTGNSDALIKEIFEFLESSWG